MKQDCEICGGSGFIRLPVRQKLSVSKIQATTPIRQYSCPECGDFIPQEKVSILQCEELADSRYANKDKNYLDYIYENAAYKFVSLLHKEGLITYKHGQQNTMTWQFPIVAKLGVISPRTVATFEQRVNQQQALVARIVAEETAKQIRNWNSYYDKGSGPIHKDQAINFLFEVLEKTLKQLEANP